MDIIVQSWKSVQMNFIKSIEGICCSQRQRLPIPKTWGVGVFFVDDVIRSLLIGRFWCEGCSATDRFSCR